MKRIISLSIAFMMILTSINAAAASYDTFDEKYYTEARQLLEVLNIADGSGEGTMTDTGISRINFIKLAVNAMTRGKGNFTSSGSTGYTDVTAADAGYIEFAVDTNIISDGITFNPDANADIDFAKSVITSAAGYDVKNGAYKQTAAEAGFTKKLRNAAYSDFSAGDAYVMVYNFLCAQRLIRYYDGSYVLEDRSLLGDVYGIQQIKGQLMADEYSAAYGNKCAKGMVRVDVLQTNKELELYYEGDTRELIGRCVKVYYNEDDEAVLIIPLYNNDIKAEFNGTVYMGYDSSSRKISWGEYNSSSRWEVSLKTVSEYISPDTDIIYNGRYTTEHELVYGILENGNGFNIDYIMLIDTDNNGRTDLMKIDAYTTAFVSQPNEDKLTVKDNLSNKIIDIDGDDIETEVSVFDKQGNEMSFSSIKSNSVISIFETLDAPKSIKIIASSDTEIGMVTAISESGSDCSLSIDGEEYSVSKSFSEYTEQLTAGGKYTLYLDHRGTVSGYKIGAEMISNAGGVARINIPDVTDTVLEFVIFTADGEFIHLNTALKWRVNGAKVYVTADNKTVYKDETGVVVDAVKKLKTEFILYRLDSAGNIKEIITAKQNAGPGMLGYTAGMNNPKEVFVTPEDYKLRYKTNGKFFIPDEGNESAMNFVAVNSSTKIIKMPSENITNGRENYFAAGIALRNDDNLPVVGYTLSGENKLIADIAVIVNDSSSNPENSAYYVVKEIKTALNHDDNIGYELTLYNNSGAESTVTTESLVFPEYSTSKGALTGNNLELDKGDVIRYGVNSTGDASSFIMVYDYSEKAFTSRNANKWYVGNRDVLGCVYSTEENKFSYVVGNEITGDVSGNMQIGYANSVIIVDPDERKDNYITSGTVSDMTSYIEDSSDYARIVYISGYGETKMVVAYK